MFLKKNNTTVHPNVFHLMKDYCLAYEELLSMGIGADSEKRNVSYEWSRQFFMTIERAEKDRRKLIMESSLTFLNISKISKKVHSLILQSQSFPDFGFVTESFKTVVPFLRWVYSEHFKRENFMINNQAHLFNEDDFFQQEIYLCSTNIFAPEGLMYLKKSFDSMQPNSLKSETNFLSVWNKDTIEFDGCLMFFYNPNFEETLELSPKQWIDFHNRENVFLSTSSDQGENFNKYENKTICLFERLYVIFSVNSQKEYDSKINLIKTMIDMLQNISEFHNNTISLQLTPVVEYFNKNKNTFLLDRQHLLFPVNCVSLDALIKTLVLLEEDIICISQDTLVKKMYNSNTSFFILIQSDEDFISTDELNNILINHKAIPTYISHTRVFLKADPTLEQKKQLCMRKKTIDSEILFFVMYQSNLNIYKSSRKFLKNNNLKFREQETDSFIQRLSMLNDIYDTTIFLSPLQEINVFRINSLLYKILLNKNDSIFVCFDQPIWFNAIYNEEKIKKFYSTDQSNLEKLFKMLNVVLKKIIKHKIFNIDEHKIFLCEYVCEIKIENIFFKRELYFTSFVSDKTFILDINLYKNKLENVLINSKIKSNFTKDAFLQYFNSSIK